MKKEVIISFLAGIFITGFTVLAVAKAAPNQVYNGLKKINIVFEESRETSAGNLSNNMASNSELIKFDGEVMPRIIVTSNVLSLGEAVIKKLYNASEGELNTILHVQTPDKAISELLEGKTDIIFIPDLNLDVETKARDKKIELIKVPIARDAITFFVNSANPIKSLTKPQIQKIYEGTARNWIEFGGINMNIVPFQRPKNTLAQYAMERLVMEGVKLMPPPNEVFEERKGQLAKRIAGYTNAPGAIGYSYYYYGSKMYNENGLKTIAINNVLPDKNTIINGSYPFIYSYYAVIKNKNDSLTYENKIIDFIKGKSGQKIVEEVGFAPILN